MDTPTMYDKLEALKFQLRCDTRDYHRYVAKWGWSEEDCHRVDELKQRIAEAKREMVELAYQLGADAEM